MISIIEALHTLLKENKTWTFFEDVKSFYKGDPWIIGESSLPAIIIMPSQTSINHKGTQYDQHQKSIKIVVVLNWKTIAWSTKNEEVTFLMNVIKMIEWDGTEEWRLKSIVWMLQNNLTLNNVVDNSNIASIQYPDTRGVETRSYEVSISYEAIKIQKR